MQFVHTLGATELPTNSTFEALGGVMARTTCAQRPLCGSLWVLKYPYCHQMIIQTQLRCGRRVRVKLKFKRSSGVPKQYTQQQFWGFWGAHGLGYMGPTDTMWVPMDAQVPILSPIDHPNPS